MIITNGRLFDKRRWDFSFEGNCLWRQLWKTRSSKRDASIQWKMEKKKYNGVSNEIIVSKKKKVMEEKKVK